MALSDDIDVVELVVVVGGIGMVAYILYTVLKKLPGGLGIGPAGSASDTIYNAATGALDCSQKEALAQQEAAALVKASGGTMSLQDALKQARADVASGSSVCTSTIGIGTLVFGSSCNCGVKPNDCTIGGGCAFFVSPGG